MTIAEGPVRPRAPEREEHSPEPGSFLAALPAADAAELRRHGRLRHYERGTALFHERQLAECVAVVLRGRVKVCTCEDGRECVLGVCGPGELLGELAAWDGEPHGASAVCLEPVDAVVLSARAFRALLTRLPAMAQLVFGLFARRLRDSNRKRLELCAHDTLGRVAARLVELCERYGEPTADGVRIALTLTQEDLAAWTGSCREATVKALGKLRACGLIRTERRRIVVLDLEALRRWAPRPWRQLPDREGLRSLARFSPSSPVR